MKKDLIDFAKSCLSTYKSSTVTQEWISVKKKLPVYKDEYGVVLMYSEVRGTEKGFTKNYNFYDEDLEILKDITHWMPLPEPPKK
jgi:hypothetical protein